MEKYDSANDTQNHRQQVKIYMNMSRANLFQRSQEHDLSKLESPEKEMFDEFTPKLKDSTYGSDEYKGFLKDMGKALSHHYENNQHHPEHWGEDGVNDMSLFDIVEMLVDWKAATMRHDDGDINKSLEINKERFGISEQLFRILSNTVEEMEW